MKAIQRPLAFLLALLLILSCLPTQHMHVSAAEEETVEETTTTDEIVSSDPAELSDATEASAEDTANSIVPGVEFDAVIEEAGTTASIPFTPEQTDLYTFASYADTDTFGYLCDADQTVLASNDDDGEDYNFSITYVLEAGNTYYLEAHYYDSSVTGTIPVMLSIVHDYQNEITRYPTCMEEGEETSTCQYCGDSFSDTIATAHSYVDGVCEFCGNEQPISELFSYSENSDGTITINDYTGDSSVVEIPSSIDGLTVTEIAADAFNNNSTLTSVTIPEGVHTLGSRAFYHCTNLKHVNLPSTMEFIGVYAFASCGNLESINIPDSVYNMSYGTFENCYDLKYITLGTGLTDIGNETFYECESLSHVFYTGTEEEWTSIDISTYNDCLTNATIHYGASGDDSITITESCTAVNHYCQLCQENIHTAIKDIPTHNIIDGVCTLCGFQEGVLVLDESYTVVIGEADSEVDLEFRPDQTDVYWFYSSGDRDTCATLYNANMEELYYDDDGGDSTNFGISYMLEAGNTYYLAARFLYESGTGSFPVTVTTTHAYTSETTQAPTCIAEGEETYTCQYCGDSYTSPIAASGAYHNYIDGVCQFCGDEAQTLILDTETTVTIDEAGETVVLVYECNQQDFYSFYCNIPTDGYNNAYLTLYNGTTGTLVAEYNLYYGGHTTKVLLNADTTYYFHLCYYDTTVTGSFPVTLSVSHKAYSSEMTTAPTCTEPGEYTCTCSYCGATWTEEIAPGHSYYNGQCTGCGEAEDLEGCFTYEAYNDEGVTITGYSGSYRDLVIPETLGGQAVVSISGNAFEYNDELTSVVIPEGVHSIGYDAFYDCSSLERVSLPSTLTNINSYAFAYCHALENITIPDSVTNIETSAFRSCYNLQYVTIGSGVTSINYSAFSNCSLLNHVFYTGTEEQWGAIEVGSDNEYLTDGTIHCGASGDGSVTITDTCYSTSSYCNLCQADIATIEKDIPTHTVVDGECTGCDFVEGVLVFDTPYYATIDEPGETVVLTFSTAQEHALYLQTDYSENLFYYEIYNVTNNELIGPVGPTGSSSHTFRGYADAAYELRLYYADASATGTIPVTLSLSHSYSSAVTTEPTCTTDGVRTYTCVDCDDSFTESIPAAHIYDNGVCTRCGDEQVLEECFGYMENGDGTVLITSYDGTFHDLTIPSTLGNMAVTGIDNNVFYSHTELRSVIIPEGVTYVGQSFYRCENLESVSLPSTLTNINSYAFAYCYALESITIPDSVTEMSWNVFYRCESLAYITLGSGLTYIGESSFSECESLSHVFYTGTEEQWNAIDFSYDNEALINSTVHFNTAGDSAVTTSDSCTAVTYHCTLCQEDIASVAKRAATHAYTDGVCTVCGHKEGYFDVDIPYTVTIDEPGETVTILIDAPTAHGYRVVSDDSSYGYHYTIHEPDSTPDYWNDSYDIHHSFHINEGEPKAFTVGFMDETATGSFTVTLSLSHSYNSAVTTEPTCTTDGVRTYTCEFCDYSYTEPIYASHHYDNGVCTACGDEQVLEDCFGYYEQEDGTIIISDYSGTFYDLVIPGTLDGKTVAGIDGYVFDYETSLRSVVIPDSVTYIGYNTFYYCSNLESVTLSSSLTSIEGYAFGCCSSLQSINIPESVETISYSVFHSCKNLSYVTIGSGTTQIREGAFYDCSNLSHVFYAGTEEQWNAIDFTVDNVQLTESVIHYGTSADSAVQITDSCTTTEFYCQLCESTFQSAIKANPSHEYEDGVCTICGHKEGFINLGATTIATIVNGGDSAIFQFTPEVSHTYAFFSETDYDTYGNLYDENMNHLASNDDGGNNTNFYISYYLEAGQTYNLCAKFLSSYNTGSFPVYLEMAHTWGSGVEDPKATCDSDGVMTYTCLFCNAYYSEVSPSGHIWDDGTCTRCGLTQTLDEVLLYYINEETNTVAITGYTGSFKNLEIPATIEGLPVTYIHGMVFAGNDYLESVVIPDSVTEMGMCTFENCSNLKSVKISEGITTLYSNTFQNCYNLSDVTLPSGLLEIHDSAFAGCYALTELDLPQTLTTIGAAAFDSAGLKTMTVPASVTSLAYGVFEGCDELVSVSLPDSIDSIEALTFRGCSALQSVDLPDNLTRIGPSAFEDCYNLQSIHIPASVTTIGEYAFAWCQSLSHVELPASMTTLSYNAFRYCTGMSYVTIPAGLTTIDESAFRYCYSLNHVLYKGTQEQKDAMTIGSYNSYLTDATWHMEATGSEITSIDTCVGALHTCSTCETSTFTYHDATHSYADGVCTKCGAPVGLNYSLYQDEDGTLIAAIEYYWREYEEGEEPEPLDLVIPDTLGGYPVRIIYGWAFAGLEELRTLTIPASVTYLGSGFVRNCPNLESIILAEGNTAYTMADNGVIYSADMTELVYAPTSLSGEFTVPNTVTTLAYYSFYGCDQLTKVTLPESVPYISSSTFENCSSLQSINTEYLTEGFGDRAFAGCSSLEQITIPATSTYIAYATFMGCDALESVVIPENVKSIDYCAFRYATSLQEVNIPEAVEYLDGLAFADCGNQLTVTFEGDAPDIYEEVFAYTTATAIVPAGNTTWTEDNMLNYGGFITWMDTDGNTLIESEGPGEDTLLPAAPFDYNSACTESSNEMLHICEHNFPDENFHNYILEYGGDGNMGSDPDGFLTREEAGTVQTIACEDWGISSLEGVQYFTNLRELICLNNNLTELDLSGNPYLTQLDCADNELTELDLSGNTQLLFIHCSNNPLAQLDVSMLTKLDALYCSNMMLTGLDVSKNTRLTALGCDGNPMEALDVSNNLNLRHLDYGGTGLQNVDISMLTNLDTLYCYSNGLTSLDLSGNPNLTSLHCNDNPDLTNVDLSGHPGLRFLDCSFTGMSVDFSVFTELLELRCAGLGLTALDLSKNTKLEVLHCDSNALTELDLSNNTELRELNVGDNQLTSLDVSMLTELWCLDCYNNDLTELDLSNNTGLMELDVSNNHLATLDLSMCEDMWAFGLDPQTLSAEIQYEETDDGAYAVDMSQFVGDQTGKIMMVDNADYNDQDGIAIFSEVPESLVYYINVSAPVDDMLFMQVGVNEEFSGGEGPDVDLPEQVAPFDFNPACTESTSEKLHICEHNFPDARFREWLPDGSLDGVIDGYLTREEAATMTDLYIGWEGINSLEGLQFFTNLLVLICDGNNLTELDLSGNPYLIELSCTDNALTSLDLSNNLDLEMLNCYYNNISQLDVSMLTNLQQLLCQSNNISQLDVSALTNLRILSCANNNLTQLDVSDNVNLFNLDVNQNPLEALDVSNNLNLLYLNYGATGLDVDFTMLTKLITLNCYRNGLTELDISMLPNLLGVFCQQNPDLTELDLSNHTDLQALDYSYTGLTIDISKLPELTNLQCAGQGLTSIDLSQHTGLVNLNVADNPLTELDVSMLSELAILDASNLDLDTLDLSNNTQLFELYCYNSGLTELDLSSLSGLFFLDCSENQLGTLDLSNCINLVQLNCYNAGLTSLDLSKNTNLDGVDLGEQYVGKEFSYTVSGSSYTVDMAQIVGEDNIGNITTVYDATYDPATGIATFFAEPVEIYYVYDVKLANDSQSMNVFVTSECIHNWTAADCSTNVCKYCGTVDTGVNNHNWQSATCQAPMTCSVCGEIRGNVADHRYGSWITTKLPTTESEGTRQRSCVWCDDLMIQAIDKLVSDEVVIENTTDADSNDCNATLDVADSDLADVVLGDADHSDNTMVSITLTTDEITDDALSNQEHIVLSTKFEEILMGISDISEIYNANYLLLDVNLYKQVDAEEPEKITQTAEPVEITITIPDHMLESTPDAGSGLVRDYYVVRVHDGEADVLDITSRTNTTITFRTDKFSTYSLLYVDSVAVPVAAIGENLYYSLADAIAVAKSGDTITLLADTYQSYVRLAPGVTLDLKGYTLTADYVVGLKGSAITATLHSGADVGGKLVVPQDSISLSTTATAGPNSGYKVIPIWNADHYVFAQVKINEYGEHGALTLLENNTAKLEFLPNLTSYVRDNLFKPNGCADNDVSIIIRVSWTESQAEGDIKVTQEYFYTTSLVQVAMNKISLTATTSGCDTKEGLEFTIAVVTEAGTEICSQTYVYADYVTE